MRTITLDELDAELQTLHEALQESDDALRRCFGQFQMEPDADSPSDPYSPEYREYQMNVYCKIAATSTYQLSQERTYLPSIEAAVKVPFPYYTQSAQTVGDQLMAIGFILKTLNLPTKARVLEFGPGWGNTTINLIRMGYSVTAIDIEPNFIDVIKGRAATIGCPVDARVGNFGPVPDVGAFDAILFYECFHHCADHLKLIREFRQMTHANSLIAFAAEPIWEDFHSPWAVRLDGMSLWSIRNFKWMELGYREDYFVRTMMKFGWTVSKHVCLETHLGIIYLARRSEGLYLPSDLFMPKDEERTWAARETDPALRFRNTAGVGVVTLDEDERWRTVTVDLVNIGPLSKHVHLKCGDRSSVPVEVASGASTELTIELPSGVRLLQIATQPWCPKDLGLNEDRRTLGVAVRSIRLS